MLFQEKWRDRPFWMLVGCVLVDRSHWYAVAPVLRALVARYRVPSALAGAPTAEVASMLLPLGHAARGAKAITRMADAAGNTARDDPGLWSMLRRGSVAKLPGVTRYALDSWSLFVERDLSRDPEDPQLRAWLDCELGLSERAVVFKRVEFDYGHRLMDHRGLCRNVHGHRGVVELRVEGVVEKAGGSSRGMVADFGDVKRALTEAVSPLDHAFLVERGDEALRLFLEAMPGQRVIVTAGPPTAEAIARLVADTVAPVLAKTCGWVASGRVRVRETPTAWAEVDLVG